MCGIFGWIQSGGKPIDDAVMRRMGAMLRHRGPDDLGIHYGPGMAIGNTRLAIQDIDNGKQPMYAADGRFAIVYNGEIYNHFELRPELEIRGHVFRTRSDTETFLAGFVTWGVEVLSRINGMFAVAIWDHQQQRLFLARDRFGIKPLYLLQRGTSLAFSSEPKGLFPLLGDHFRPDWAAIERYLFYGYFPGTDCAYSDISKVPSGHYGWFEQGKLRLYQFYRPQNGGFRQYPVDKIVAGVAQGIEHAVRRQLLSDIPVGLYLSGGLDSSAVAWAASRAVSGGLRSFALRFEEATHDESADARRVAEHLGLDHHEIMLSNRDAVYQLSEMVDCLDEPFGDSTALPLLFLSKAVAQMHKVVLSGWGGDELFAGYPTLKAHALSTIYRKIPEVIRHKIIPELVKRLPVSDRYMSFEFKTKRFIRGDTLAQELQHFHWMGYLVDNDQRRRLLSPELCAHLGEMDCLSPVTTALANLTEVELIDRILHLDQIFFLEANGLYQADRMSMAASLEVRVPLLDNVLFDAIAPLVSSIKMRYNQPKWLLKEALRPHLPKAIIEKRKKGFGPPSSSWVRGPFSEVVADTLSAAKLKRQGILNPEAVTLMIDQHRCRIEDHGRNIWMLLSFQLWYDRHIVGAGTRTN